MFALKTLMHGRRGGGSPLGSTLAAGWFEQEGQGFAALRAGEADWLLRVLLSCFGLTVCVRQPLQPVASLHELGAALAARGLELQRSSLRSERELRRGDVLRLDPRVLAQHGASVGRGGVAVVVDDGAPWVRLRAASSAEPFTCARGALRSLRGAGMLRVTPEPAAVRAESPGWDSRLDSGLDSGLDSSWSGRR